MARFSRSRAATRRKTAWIAGALPTADTSVAAATTSTVEIISAGELFDEEVTLCRVIGDLRIQNTSGAENYIYAGIRLQQSGLADASSRRPDVNHDDEQWLWWRCFMLPSSGTYTIGNSYGAADLGINIKARRKWSPDHELVFIARAAGTFDYGIACRVLVYLP